MIEGAGVVACACNHYLSKAGTAQKLTRKRKKKKLGTREQTGNDVQYPGSATKKTQKTVKAPAKKTDKKMSDEPDKVELELPETGKVSLYKNKKTILSVHYLNAPLMRPIISVFYTCECPYHILVDVLDPVGWIVFACSTG